MIRANRGRTQSQTREDKTNPARSGESGAYPSVGRQCECAHGGFQLLLGGGGVAAVAADHWSDLDVEFLGLLVIKVGITGVEVVFLLVGAACRRKKRESRRRSRRC